MGEAQDSPGTQDPFPVRFDLNRCQAVQLKKMTVNTIKYGRNGSSSVKLAIQAPLIPNERSTSGPAQHRLAPNAAASPPAMDQLVFATTNPLLMSFMVGV